MGEDEAGTARAAREKKREKFSSELRGIRADVANLRNDRL